MEGKLKQGMMLLPAALLLSLASCKGVGLSEMNSKDSAWETESPEQHSESVWWDYFYHRRVPGPESKAWGDVYKAPAALDSTRPSYCGYWGNCAPSDRWTGEKDDPQCNFYGHCEHKSNEGWW